jgi:hypothetical protein
MIPVDNSLMSRGIDFLRFVDDMVVFAKTERECRRRTYEIADVLDKQQRLVPNPSKTKIWSTNRLEEHCAKMIEDRPINDLEDHLLAIIRKYSNHNSLIHLSEHREPDVITPGAFPSYKCDIATDIYRNRPDRFGALLKVHGSLNWLYCPNYHRLDLAISESGRHFVKALDELWWQSEDARLVNRYRCTGAPCPNCGQHVRPVMITPTQKKDYRNPHIARIWYEAERALRQAERAVFIGYSMPEDDVEVVYLLKRGLAHLAPSQITVVEYVRRSDHTPLPLLAEHPVGARYRALFGDGIDWHPEGFNRWAQTWEP